MSDLDQWQHGNEQYLAAALAWLRLLLERHVLSLNIAAPIAPQPPVVHATTPLPKRGLWMRWAAERNSPPEQQPPLPSPMPLLPPAQVSKEQVDEAAAIMVRLETEMETPPALVILGQRFALSPFERYLLLLCAAMELDTRISGLCAQAHNDPARAYPTFALALTLFSDSAAWDALSPERPLRHFRFIEINQPGAQPLTTSALRADEWVVNYLKGLSYLDDRMTPFLVPLEVEGEVELPASQRAIVEAIVHGIHHAPPMQNLPVIQLLGYDGPSKQLVASSAAAELGLHLYRMPAGLLPQQAVELETLARLWQRQAMMLPVCLYLDAREVESNAGASAQNENQPVPPVNRFLSRSNGIFFLDTREVWPRLERTSLLHDVSKPVPVEQQSAWADELKDAAGGNPARLANQFNLNLSEIRQIARGTLNEVKDESGAIDEGLLSGKLWDACLLATRPKLDALAHRLEPKATWDDIVLPESELEVLRHIANQVRQRNKVYDEWGFRRKMSYGLSINALFAGESGTGKTMAAEVIANELRLNLYRIDLSAVVSKYIGETEKNLSRLFDAAEGNGIVLFFDEADAIFGKRSEVKDAHDRYANIEINYLLQRMETYSGLAVLATNMKSALDTAFIRRLRFIVNFQKPGARERKLIWQRAFTPQVPVEGLDFDRLADFNFTGGDISSIALNASFLAAQAGTPVTMPLVLKATRLEYGKHGWAINEADFRWQTAAGQVA
jgi:hypothetical protein